MFLITIFVYFQCYFNYFKNTQLVFYRNKYNRYIRKRRNALFQFFFIITRRIGFF